MTNQKSVYCCEKCRLAFMETFVDKCPFCNGPTAEYIWIKKILVKRK